MVFSCQMWLKYWMYVLFALPTLGSTRMQMDILYSASNEECIVGCGVCYVQGLLQCNAVQFGRCVPILLVEPDCLYLILEHKDLVSCGTAKQYLSKWGECVCVCVGVCQYQREEQGGETERRNIVCRMINYVLASTDI